MTDEQRRILADYKSEYLSIGINADGEAYGVIGIPWAHTANAHNMKLPDVYITPDDLEDESVMQMILEHKVIGCYIWVPLEDYSFIARFTEIRDVTIHCGDSIRNLDFLKDCHECILLYLENAKLENIDVILDLNQKKNSPFGGLFCVALFNCEIKDNSRFKQERFRFAEFLIYEYEGKNEREKWRNDVINSFRYYEVKR